MNKKSEFAGRNLDEIYDEIRSLYKINNYPWIIGFSGGKDSTAVAQLVWNALKGMPKEEFFKPVYIISSDTLVEIPKVVNHIDKNITKMNKSANVKKFPFKAVKVEPDTSDSFWVNLIGRGYPAPTNEFRWCTDRLKIDPVTKFIKEKASEHSEVVVVLGVRKDESSSRKQRIENHKIEGNEFSRHTTIPQAYVYTPIEDWGVEDVWGYLKDYKCPWGMDNYDLINMYRKASDGECPLVVDMSSPSCGNSRFGCWCCTVVKNEKSLSSLINNGEVWLTPLKVYREKLMDTQDPDKKHLYRDYKRRDGRIYYIKSQNEEVPDKLGRGPYLFDFRKEMLTELLEAEKEVNKFSYEKFNLITMPELLEIRRLWQTELNDWEDSVSKIYKEVYDRELEVIDSLGVFSPEDKNDIIDICSEKDFNETLILELLTATQYYSYFSTKKRLLNKVDEIFRKEWRSEEEIVEGLK